MKIKNALIAIREYVLECYERGQMIITLKKTEYDMRKLNKQLKKVYEAQEEANEAFKRLQLWSEGGDPYGE